MTDPATSAAAPEGVLGTPQRRFESRVADACRLSLPLLIVPLLVGIILGGQQGAFSAAMGSFFGFFMALGAGYRIAAWIMPVAVAVGGACSLIADSPGWVLLLAAIGLLAGLMTRFGMLAPFALVGVVASVTPSVDRPGQAVAVILLGGLGAWNGVHLARRLGVAAIACGDAVELPRAALAGVLLSLVAGIAGSIALQWDSPHAFWLPMSVFLIANPSAGLLLHQRALQRLTGTILAVLASLLLIPLPIPPVLRGLLSIACFVLAMVYPRPLWCNAALTTLALLLIIDIPGTDPEVGIQRLAAVALGAALMLAAMALASVIDRWRPFSPQAQQMVRDLATRLHPSD